jgi:hypothetical protein
MSFRESYFWVEIPAFEVVKENNKNLMSKTFFIFSSIPKENTKIWCIRRTQ